MALFDEEGRSECVISCLVALGTNVGKIKQLAVSTGIVEADEFDNYLSGVADAEYKSSHPTADGARSKKPKLRMRLLLLPLLYQPSLSRRWATGIVESCSNVYKQGLNLLEEGHERTDKSFEQ
ncbi:unnamed protein product [Sphagnum jensenii]|uniref:Uncharacterized protein n=1 Tax=Sphagnum jensenii TaxID=128206 RepID=A0ABP0VCG8_9BRYO